MFCRSVDVDICTNMLIELRGSSRVSRIYRNAKGLVR
jgi:hypothetical protein